MNMHESNDSSPLLCARCGVELTPGVGNLYVVRIEAMADPTPPHFSEDDLQRDPGQQIAALIEQMRNLSEQELVDQVYRRLFLHMCGPCYRQWIEDPVR